MDRYKACSESQKEILDKLFWYLGFNEVTTFENYIEFMFKNAKSSVEFVHVVNHTLQHIVTNFWDAYPIYHKNNYIKFLWLNEKDMMNHMCAGSEIDFDPKGLLRLFVINNFKKLVDTKR
jgi:hypothetical protein